MRSHRRNFLRSAIALVATPLAPGLGRLAELSRLAAADTRIDPSRVRLDPAIADLVRLVRTTAPERCVQVFAERLQNGLSYHDFLAALFFASIEHGDPHQIAGVYAAHRLSSHARPEDRLLPLFWSLDRLTQGFAEEERPTPPALTGPLPRPADAERCLREAMGAKDPDAAERAIVVLSQSTGNHHAMTALWEHGTRRVHGTLAHHPILCAGIWRSLEALGWHHADPVLRYMARGFARLEADDTFEPHRELARETVPGLAADWAGRGPDREVTIELFRLLRSGDTEASRQLVIRQLRAGVRAGALWDAIDLVAADLLYRYRSGGMTIGGYLIHAVTGTNALRFGFDSSADGEIRLVMLLQAVAIVGNLFVAEGRKNDELRDRCLLDLDESAPPAVESVVGIFELLPKKRDVAWSEEPAGVRDASDEACRSAFALLRTPGSQTRFEQTARTLLCAKATRNAHDLKYPIAAFENVTWVDPEWRPYILAAAVHALHGTASDDTPVLARARAALR